MVHHVLHNPIILMCLVYAYLSQLHLANVLNTYILTMKDYMGNQ